MPPPEAAAAPEEGDAALLERTRAALTCWGELSKSCSLGGSVEAAAAVELPAAKRAKATVA